MRKLLTLCFIWRCLEAASIDFAIEGSTDLPDVSNSTEMDHPSHKRGLTDLLEVPNLTEMGHPRHNRAAGDPITVPDGQYCILYNDINAVTGAQKLITDYVADLEELGWNDVVSSTKCYGIWLLYHGSNFNPTGLRGEIYKTVRFSPSLSKLEGDFDDQDNKFTSLRFAGAVEDPFNVNSLTLYEHRWFAGEEFFTLEDIPRLPDRMNDKGSSVIVTGTANWTLYSEPEFQGSRKCVIHGSNGEVDITDLQEDGDLNERVSSVKIGC